MKTCIYILVLFSFDLVAVGGISVTLIFERAPFITERRTLWLPWNQFVVVDKVIMTRVETAELTCDVSNFISPYPIVLPSPLTIFAGSCSERGPAVPELQVMHIYQHSQAALRPHLIWLVQFQSKPWFDLKYDQHCNHTCSHVCNSNAWVGNLKNGFHANKNHSELKRYSLIITLCTLCSSVLLTPIVLIHR